MMRSVFQMGMILMLGVCLTGCAPEVVRRTDPLPSEVYVWQRVWKPEMGTSIVHSKDWVQTYHLLAAEVRFEKGDAKVLRMKPDRADLEGMQVGLVLRIFPSAAKTGWDARAVAEIAELVQSLVAEWPAGKVGEVQLDYDCPDSKLADYARLLGVVKRRMAPLKVTCTALPSWLRQKDFVGLAAVVPSYVLQVHSLHLPEVRNRAVALVDLAETREAVSRAVKIGVPFRVALPTYSCVVEFNAEGKVREVYAEDVPQSLALQSANYVVLDADAYGMANLVSQWRADASPLMQAVVWYRLPVAGDRLNWRLEVLEKVARGKSLARGWKGRAMENENGHMEIVIEQTGDAPDDLPVAVVVRWDGAEVTGADGLRGYGVAESRAGYLALRLAQPGRIPRMAPGAKTVIGWLRGDGKMAGLTISPGVLP